MSARWELIEDDALEAMRGMEAESVDAVCTDPPYFLTFMGRSWDHAPTPKEGQSAHEAWAREALRLLKPGGHLLAAGGSRTYHRLTCAIEDAGFEIRDCLCWHFAQGFPKSASVSKQIDRAAGAEREVVGERDRYLDGRRRENLGNRNHWGETTTFATNGVAAVTAPATPEAEAWDGWGTALKPSTEFFVLARKPLAEGTVAAQVLATGTGALNIGATRIESSGDRPLRQGVAARDYGWGTISGGSRAVGTTTQGRWPANAVFSHSPECVQVGTRRVKGSEEKPQTANRAMDGWGMAANGHKPGYADPDGMEEVAEWRCAEGCPVAELDRQSGVRETHPGTCRRNYAAGLYGPERRIGDVLSVGDTGAASRFFFCSKAAQDERFIFCRHCDTVAPASARDRHRHGLEGWSHIEAHPCVKPLDLVRWLVRLITPPGGLCLDPFAGTGTTGAACIEEGFRCVLIEREPAYARIARERLAAASAQGRLELIA